MDEPLKERMQRARSVKLAIAALALAGPRFLYSPSDNRNGQLVVDRYSQVWYVDAFTGVMLYPFPGYPWKGFSGGRGLKDVVLALATYVRDGQLVDLALLDGICAEAYGNEWPAVRGELVAQSIFTETPG